MPIEQLHPTIKGLPPLDTPLAGAAIEDRLRDGRQEKPTAAGTRLRCSSAYGCSRKIAFESLGIPKDITYTQQQLLTFKAGDWYHTLTQEALVRTFDARTEVPVDWSPTGLSLSGSCDAVYVTPTVWGQEGPVEIECHVVAVEIKSQAGYGYDVAVGRRKGRELPGPKYEHVLQDALYGLAPNIGAQFLHIVYINKDRGEVAEWLLDVDEPLPHIADNPTPRGMVTEEINRLHGILARLDNGEIPRRVVPGYGKVEDPPAADSRDDPWNCRYCSWQPTCAELIADPIPDGVAMLKKLKGMA